ncbi:MAG TPA: hypothetical protein VGJ05_14210 [Fimbriiglobus sp.]|jgi:hypothetical protein
MTAQQPYTSSVAELIDRAARRSREQSRDSTLGHREALEELSDVWDECRKTGWDGYGALPVEQDTLRMAYTLVESLPLGFPRPSIGAEPDGQLTLEWRKTPRRILSVSVDPDGYLHYAGLFGTNKRYGSLAYFSTAPVELLQLVRDL